MTLVKPFAAIRPKRELAEEIAALPYDVYSRKEACAEIKKHPMSFLRIDRPETNFDDSVGTYDDRVYKKANELLWKMVEDGEFIREEEPRYYIYELTWKDVCESGIVGCVSVDDFEDGTVKKHENTRAEKEEDRIRHIDAVNAQTGPIFLAHKKNHTIAEIIGRTKKLKKPIYEFTTDGGVTNRVFVVDDGRDIDNISFAFSNIPNLYIADGHHRAASAVAVAKKRRKENLRHTGDEPYNYIMSVLFCEDELKILDYNRAVRDLNQQSPDKILERMSECCDLLDEGFYALEPRKKGEFSMFLDDKWYRYAFKEHLLDDDPVKGLDVSILQDNILHPIFGINDPKRDKRIDFVGGIRGLLGLEKRCEEDCSVAFAMYPTSMEELFNVADANLLMPPKSTWFEPKLLSGLFIHQI